MCVVDKGPVRLDMRADRAGVVACAIEVLIERFQIGEGEGASDGRGRCVMFLAIPCLLASWCCLELPTDLKQGCKALCVVENFWIKSFCDEVDTTACCWFER